MKIKAVCFFIILSVSTMLCSGVSAEYAPEVTSVGGSPKIMKNGSGSWTDCAEKTVILNGDRIKTDKDDSVTIAFAADMKNVIMIGSDSEAVILSGREPVYTIELFKGEVKTLLLSLPEDSTFMVKTPTGVSVARGTGWRSVTDGLVSVFEAYDNTIYVKGLYADGGAMDNEVFVDMGYKTVVRKLSQPDPVQKLESEDMERWNAWRDELENKEAKSTEISDRGGIEPSEKK